MLDLDQIAGALPGFEAVPLQRKNGATAYRLPLPDFPPGREFDWAEVVLPKGFPDSATARIFLPPGVILKIPHVEEGGALCIDGDPGPSANCSPENRILHLIDHFYERFLNPWLRGDLDGEFAKESLNYWALFVDRMSSARRPIVSVATVDGCPRIACVREATLLSPKQLIVVADLNDSLTRRLGRSISGEGLQFTRAIVADIPIRESLTPQTWPRNYQALLALLQARLDAGDFQRFTTRISRRGRPLYRLALFRNEWFGYAYLMPDWPATRLGKRVKGNVAFERKKMLPLPVRRWDPAWTVGRDQISAVESRQKSHVVIFGIGALGSFVADHLAKAGVGKITLVDPEILESENIGRHFLGAHWVRRNKVEGVAATLNQSYPTTQAEPVSKRAQDWLQYNTFAEADLVLDLTGDRDVRWAIDRARQDCACALLIGWLEPFVAAAHACLLPAGSNWYNSAPDSLERLQATEWPKEVTQQVPGCSSRFQSYTASAAAYAVALVSEQALRLLDGKVNKSCVVSWVRGQQYFDEQWPGLVIRDWAKLGSELDGATSTRTYP